MDSTENETSGFKKEIEEISNKLLGEFKTLVTELFKIERDKIEQKVNSDNKNRSKDNSVENNKKKLFESIPAQLEKVRPVSATVHEDNKNDSSVSSSKPVPVRKTFQNRPSDRRNAPKSPKSSSEDSDESELKQNLSGDVVRKIFNRSPRGFESSSTEIEKIAKTPIRRKSVVQKPIPPFPNKQDKNPKSDVLSPKIPISSPKQLKRNCTLTSIEGYCSDCKQVVLAEKGESANKDNNKNVNKDKNCEQSTKPQAVVKDASIQKDGKVERFIEHLGRKLHKFEPLQRILAQRMIAEICSYARRKKLSVNTISSFATLFLPQSNISRIKKSDDKNFSAAIAKKPSNILRNSESIDEKEILIKEEKRNEGKETKKPFELDRITLAEIDTIVRREKALLDQYINF